MIHRPISVKLNQGPRVVFYAELTAEQVAKIQREFQRTPEWASFLEYVTWVDERHPTKVAGPIVDKFESVLCRIIAQHSLIRRVLMWPVMDQMYEDVTGKPAR